MREKYEPNESQKQLIYEGMLEAILEGVWDGKDEEFLKDLVYLHTDQQQKDVDVEGIFEWKNKEPVYINKEENGNSSSIDGVNAIKINENTTIKAAMEEIVKIGMTAAIWKQNVEEVRRYAGIAKILGVDAKNYKVTQDIAVQGGGIAVRQGKGVKTTKTMKLNAGKKVNAEKILTDQFLQAIESNNIDECNKVNEVAKALGMIEKVKNKLQEELAEAIKSNDKYECKKVNDVAQALGIEIPRVDAGKAKEIIKSLVGDDPNDLDAMLDNSGSGFVVPALEGVYDYLETNRVAWTTEEARRKGIANLRRELGINADRSKLVGKKVKVLEKLSSMIDSRSSAGFMEQYVKQAEKHIVEQVEQAENELTGVGIERVTKEAELKELIAQGGRATEEEIRKSKADLEAELGVLSSNAHGRLISALIEVKKLELMKLAYSKGLNIIELDPGKLDKELIAARELLDDAVTYREEKQKELRELTKRVGEESKDEVNEKQIEYTRYLKMAKYLWSAIKRGNVKITEYQDGLEIIDKYHKRRAIKGEESTDKYLKYLKGYKKSLEEIVAGGGFSGKALEVVEAKIEETNVQILIERGVKFTVDIVNEKILQDIERGVEFTVDDEYIKKIIGLTGLHNSEVKQDFILEVRKKVMDTLPNEVRRRMQVKRAVFGGEEEDFDKLKKLLNLFSDEGGKDHGKSIIYKQSIINKMGGGHFEKFKKYMLKQMLGKVSAGKYAEFKKYIAEYKKICGNLDTKKGSVANDIEDTIYSGMFEAIKDSDSTKIEKFASMANSYHKALSEDQTLGKDFMLYYLDKTTKDEISQYGRQKRDDIIYALTNISKSEVVSCQDLETITQLNKDFTGVVTNFLGKKENNLLLQGLLSKIQIRDRDADKSELYRSFRAVIEKINTVARPQVVGKEVPIRRVLSGHSARSKSTYERPHR